MKIKSKLFVITGAAGGIGREIVKEILRKEGKVAALDIREDDLNLLKESAKKNSDEIETFKVDITNLTDVETTAIKIVESLGEPDGLINAAGIIQPFMKVADLDYNTIEKVMNVNFYGTLYMVKTFLPYLLGRPEAHIVNISSMGGFLPVPGQAIYGASKAAVKLLSEALYAELKSTNVKVTVVFPGATKTKIAEHSGIRVSEEKEQESKFPMLEPDEAARIIIDGIEKDRFQVFTGNDSKFMNFLYRLNPRFAVDFITKRMGSLLENKQF